MNDTRNNIPEKIAILILSFFLLAGAFILYLRHSRPMTVVTVEKSGIHEQVSLSEIHERLKEARRVDINAADAEDLEVIPGIGPVLARRIVGSRDALGKFTSEDDLLRVQGIGPVKLESMREYIRIEP